MRRRPLWLPLGLAAAVLLAGCGGSKTYSLAKTRACLSQQHGVALVSSVDFSRKGVRFSSERKKPFTARVRKAGPVTALVTLVDGRRATRGAVVRACR